MNGDNGNSKEEVKSEVKESPDDVINQVTLMEIVIKRHRDNSETMQLICQEDLMTNHKKFLIKKLITAIDIVLNATAQNKNKVVVGTNGMINKFKNRVKGAFGAK
jgi:hypothetical protein